MNKITKATICIYALFAIATYGNAIDHFEQKGIEKVRICKIEYPKSEYCNLYKADGLAAVISTVLWPLYWSYRLQRGAK